MSLGMRVVRKAGAQVFLTSEDEWYKAAYHAGSGTYYDYPAGSDTQTTCTLPGTTANTANCRPAVDDLTDVGSYTGSASPNGTFDQGGNVKEWHECCDGVRRGIRGGGFVSYPGRLAASAASADLLHNRTYTIGFRVASVPGGWFPICGDGVIEGTEECDDGDTLPGDGCDASCQVESGWTCGYEPSVCTEDPTPVPSMGTTGLTALGVAVFGIGLVGLVIAARRRRG